MRESERESDDRKESGDDDREEIDAENRQTTDKAVSFSLRCRINARAVRHNEMPRFIDSSFMHEPALTLAAQATDGRVERAFSAVA